MFILKLFGYIFFVNGKAIFTLKSEFICFANSLFYYIPMTVDRLSKIEFDVDKLKDSIYSLP